MPITNWNWRSAINKPKHKSTWTTNDRFSHQQQMNPSEAHLLPSTGMRHLLSISHCPTFRHVILWLSCAQLYNIIKPGENRTLALRFQINVNEHKHRTAAAATCSIENRCAPFQRAASTDFTRFLVVSRVADVRFVVARNGRASCARLVSSVRMCVQTMLWCCAQGKWREAW